jgi:hypothetical protein
VLGQLSHASQCLNGTPDAALHYTTQIDELLDDIVRQQKEIAQRHEAWLDQYGDTTQTVQLDITQAISTVAYSRCALPALSTHGTSPQSSGFQAALVGTNRWCSTVGFCRPLQGF